MPFRKKKPDGTYRKHLYIRRKNLPGFGDTGTLCTFTTVLSRALEMERLVEDLANHGYYDILEAVRPRGRRKSGLVTLPELLRKKESARDEAGARWRDELRRLIYDPPLETVAREVARHIPYENHTRGVRHLLRLLPRLAPQKVPLSWLKDPSNVNALVRAMLNEGYKPNSVLNSLWGAVSRILQHAYDKQTARAVLARSDRPYANDAREVWLTPEELHDVISACEWEVRMYIILSCALGIDRSPLLRIRKRDIDWNAWRLWVRDTKTDARTRNLGLNMAAAYVLHRMGRGLRGADHLFTLTSQQIYFRWRAAREAAGLSKKSGFPHDVRTKDLRHTFAVHYLRGGGNLAGLQSRLGHKRAEQSMAYAKHEEDSRSDMEAAAGSMGLRLPENLAAHLPAPSEAEAEDYEMPEWWFDRDAPPSIGEVMKRYAPRGEAGYATDPKQWNRERMRRKRAEQKKAG